MTKTGQKLQSENGPKKSIFIEQRAIIFPYNRGHRVKKFELDFDPTENTLPSHAKATTHGKRAPGQCVPDRNLARIFLPRGPYTDEYFLIVFTRIRYFCFLFYFEYAILNNTNKNDTIREKNLPFRQKTNLEWLFLLIYGRILEKAYLSIFLQENSIQIDFFFIYLQFSANASPLQLSKTEN